MRSNVPLPHPQDPKQGFVFIQDPASRPLSTPFAQQFTSLAQASVDGAPHATQQRPFNPPPPQPSNAAQWHSIPPNATTVAPSSRKIPSPAPTSNPPIPTTPAVSAPAVKVQSPHSASKSTLAKDILRSLRGGSLFASPAKVTPPSQGDAAVGDKRKRRESDVGEHLEDPQVLKKTVLEQAKQGVDLVELPMSAWMESDSDGLNRDQSPFHEQIELPAPQPSYLQGPHQNEAGFTAHTPIDLTSDSDRSQARTPHSDILADGNLLSSGVIPLEGFFPPADEVNMNLEYPDRTPTPPLEATIRPVEDEDEVINVTTVDELPDASDDYDLDIVNVGAPLVPLVNATPSPSLAASEESTFVKRPGLLDAESPEEPPETSTSTPDRALRREFTPETESKTKRSLKVYVLVPSPPPYVRQLRAREARRRQGSQDEKEEDSTRAASDHMQRRPCGWTGCPVTLNSEEALLLHVQEHLGDVGEPRKAQSRIVACQWKSCREVKAAGMMKNHLAGHATGEMYCPYEGCDQWFRQDGQLHRHEQTHGEHEALRPSTKPFRPDLGEGLPPLSKVVPTWMSATRKVATEPISQDRHSKLGPWVRRAFFVYALCAGSFTWYTGPAPHLRPRQPRVAARRRQRAALAPPRRQGRARRGQRRRRRGHWRWHRRGHTRCRHAAAVPRPARRV
ncbi:hypothetical protein FA95DRAFT_680914 [Auriscalpium vulgare]|uniref:Uncharacterized protein n=1 Tax=Auriscalpium vulgare TaxID=40419 RepID=A0ACB8RBM2_9AGAM|nr:hypothetical protein FA95DRAFT_680914 [Auriscalpium vulgare]